MRHACHHLGSTCGRRSFHFSSLPPFHLVQIYFSMPLCRSIFLSSPRSTTRTLGLRRLSAIPPRAPAPDQGGVAVQGGVRARSPWRSGRSGHGDTSAMVDEIVSPSSCLPHASPSPADLLAAQLPESRDARHYPVVRRRHRCSTYCRHVLLTLHRHKSQFDSPLPL